MNKWTSKTIRRHIQQQLFLADETAMRLDDDGEEDEEDDDEMSAGRVGRAIELWRSPLSLCKVNVCLPGAQFMTFSSSHNLNSVRESLWTLFHSARQRSVVCLSK